MRLINELIYRHIGRTLVENFETTKVDYSGIAQTTALQALQEIKTIVNNNEFDDFMIVDEIVSILIKYGIDTSKCHDF